LLVDNAKHILVILIVVLPPVAGIALMAAMTDSSGQACRHRLALSDMPI
jgi:hypothetical protein